MEGYVEYGDNIIKRISERRGIPYEEVKEIIDLNIMHINNLANDPEVTGIYLGKNLGKLMANFNLMTSHVIRDRNHPNKTRRDFVNHVLEPRMKKIKKFFEEKNKEEGLTVTNYDKPSFLYLLRTRFAKKYDRTFNVTDRPERLWEYLSEVQNEITMEMEKEYE